MTTPVFVAPAALLAAAHPGSMVRLSGPEGRHAVTVRRLRVGEAVDLVDGQGLRVTGSVAAIAGPGDLDIAVTALHRQPPPPVRVVVVQALLKGEAMMSAVEMLTEIGVDEIVPWSAQRSIAAWRGERAGKAADRLALAVAAAGKQSRRALFPGIGPLADGPAVARRCRDATTSLVLHESAAERLADIEPPHAGEIVLVVGPEGGIAPEELAAFTDAGACSVRMGESVLRAATAGTAAGSVILARCGRWN